VARRRRPKLRLLFDELLPWDVAEALHVLGYNASHVGNERHGQPPRGSSDAAVLGHATATGQIVVTYNHDMIMICAEQGVSVIWLDPRGRQFLKDELVVLAFSGIARWQAALRSADGPVCLRVLRTKVEIMELDRASRLAERRMKAIERKRRARRRLTQESPGQLSTEVAVEP
jgi:predicted nuclease of predicted toxin-antitoxin system